VALPAEVTRSIPYNSGGDEPLRNDRCRREERHLSDLGPLGVVVEPVYETRGNFGGVYAEPLAPPRLTCGGQRKVVRVVPTDQRSVETTKSRRVRRA
jgi:hypothetical protein